MSERMSDEKFGNGPSRKEVYVEAHRAREGEEKWKQERDTFKVMNDEFHKVIDKLEKENTELKRQNAELKEKIKDLETTHDNIIYEMGEEL